MEFLELDNLYLVRQRKIRFNKLMVCIIVMLILFSEDFGNLVMLLVKKLSKLLLNEDIITSNLQIFDTTMADMRLIN